MRIMKFIRRKGGPRQAGPTPIKVDYEGEGLETVTVRILNRTISRIIPVKFLDSEGRLEGRRRSIFEIVGLKVKEIRSKISIAKPAKDHLVSNLKKGFHISRKWAMARENRRLVVLAAVVILIGVVSAIFAGTSSPPPARAPSASHATKQLPHGTPGYPTVLPAGKTIQELGGWTRISPQGKPPVYAYVDSIGKVRIDVSEQPLPSNLKTRSGMEQLAQGFGNTEKFTVNGTIVYLGPAANGGQSLIFNESDILILIKAVSPLSSDRWIQYISSLR